MRPKSGILRFLPDRKRYDAWRRALVGRLLGRLYRRTETTLHRDGKLSAAGIHRILVCRPNHRLGNALLLTPLIVELGRIFPDAKVDVVVGGGAGPDVFRDFDNIAHVVCLPRHMAKHPIRVVRTLLSLRRERYDLAVDPSEASQSGRLLLAAAKAKNSIGASSRESRRDAGMPAATRNAPQHMAHLPVFLLRDALSPAGFEAGDYPGLTLRLSATEREAARATLDTMARGGSEGPKVTVGIFASATGNKRYDRAWWLRFVKEIRALQPAYAIVELGTEQGHAELPEELPSFSSKSIREVAAFISNMSCFVSADCGVMHLASASQATTIGLFCVSDPGKYAPYGKNSRAIVTAGKSPEEVAQAVVSVVQAQISSNYLPGNAMDPASLATSPAMTHSRHAHPLAALVAHNQPLSPTR